MLSNRHEQAAQWYGTLHAWVQGPVLLTATVMAPASIMFENEAYCKIATVGAFLFIAIAQGLLYTNDLPGMKERHLNYAARYADLVTDISENLAKSERARQPCAVFTMKVKTAWDALNRTAPRLPKSGGYDSRRAPRSRRAAARVYCPIIYLLSPYVPRSSAKSEAALHRMPTAGLDSGDEFDDDFIDD